MPTSPWTFIAKAITTHGDPQSVRGYLRVSETVNTCDSPPLVPVICKVYLPIGEVREVDTFNVALVPFVGFGVKEAVALLGSPPRLKDTDPAKPLSRVIVTL